MLPWRKQASRKERGPEPISLSACYARTPEELDLFISSSPDTPTYLCFEEALSAFHGTTVSAGNSEFEYKGYYWQLQQRETPDGRRTVYLAVQANSSQALSKPSSGACTPCGDYSRQSSGKQLSSSPSLNSTAFYAPDTSPGLTPREGSYFMGAHAYNGSPTYQPSYHVGHYEYHSSRDFWNKINLARGNGAADERYNAIMWLIDACKQRAQSIPVNTPWNHEPALSLLRDILEVGEALATFGNCQFPEHSNELRTILAADFKRLMQEYLGKLGSVFVPGAASNLPSDVQNKLRSVGSKLDTRCSTYHMLFDQLLTSVGREGRGGGSAIVVNAPTTNITANPTNTNHVTASPVNNSTSSAQSKAKALQQGMSAAAIAAGGAVGLLLLKMMRGGGGGGGRGGRGKKGGKGRGGSASGAESADGKKWRLPKDRAGREMVLVGQLSSCADEMRKAKVNEDLLKDDWRLGRMRLGWPPAPEPLGYQQVTTDACNVTHLLQDMYGR